MARRILILGSTGSIGTQALDVVEASGEELEVVGLSADRNFELLLAQAERYGVKLVALSDPDAAARASENWTAGRVLPGLDGVVELIRSTEPDLVLNAIVGSAGLLPTVTTLGEGIDLALANKESMVVGGDLVKALAEATGTKILPVDSEHSAIFQLLAGKPSADVSKLVITASGGPFRGRSAADLQGVTVEQALAHPTWSMGGKITIDSATLMNKGLEVIEAHYLFDMPYRQIDVVVHPQSLIHSLITLSDGSMLAHLGKADMRVPISYALHYPDRAPMDVEPLDLAAVSPLTFEEPDLDTFRSLALARAAGIQGGAAPCVLNAANEVAVYAFMAGQIAFLDIAQVVEATLDRLSQLPAGSFEELIAADREARACAHECIATV